MSNLLINEPPLLVSPTLAVKIGLNEALILQQMHFWLSLNQHGIGRVVDGQKWIYNTVKQWKEQFPFFSESTINRAIKTLRSLGLVDAQKLSGNTYDKTLHYRIDYEKLAEVESSNWINPFSQNDKIEFVKMNESNESNCQNIYTETTAETTAETTTNKAVSEPKPINQTPSPAKKTKHPTPLDVFGLPPFVKPEVWDSFVAHRKALKKPLTNQAANLVINKLIKFFNAGHDVNAVLETSVMNGWTGVFEPKAQASSYQSRQEKKDGWLADLTGQSSSNLFDGNTYEGEVVDV